MIPTYDEVPVSIIRNNLKTAGISREEYFRLLRSVWSPCLTAQLHAWVSRASLLPPQEGEPGRRQRPEHCDEGSAGRVGGDVEAVAAPGGDEELVDLIGDAVEG